MVLTILQDGLELKVVDLVHVAPEHLRVTRDVEGSVLDKAL
jgi:hypothetical protein